MEKMNDLESEIRQEIVNAAGGVSSGGKLEIADELSEVDMVVSRATRNIIRLIRKSMLSGDAIIAGIRSVNEELDWKYWDKNDIVHGICWSMMEAVGLNSVNFPRGVKVERIAMAIHSSASQNEWDGIDDWLQDKYRDRASAAIMAMEDMDDDIERGK